MDPMKRKLSRLTALLLAFVLLAAAPLAARAEDAILIYKLGDQQYLGLNRLTGELEKATASLPAELEIPAEIQGCAVVSIRDRLFYGKDELTSVTVPSSVRRIGDEAFSACRSLQSVTLEEGVTTLGKKAFRYCYGLKEVNLPSTLKTIGSGAFDHCIELKTIVLPDSVTAMGNEVFATCSSLTSVTLPASLNTYGTYLFQDCTSLQSIQLPDTLQEIPPAMFFGCTALESITLSSALKTINKGAFGECSSLRRLVLPEGVTRIDDWAFYGCSSLRQLAVPSTVEYISKDAFYSCDNVTFYVKAGSYAQVVAAARGWPFEEISSGEEPGVPEDPGAYPATPFADAEAVGWAREYIRWAYAMGYMGSTSRYRQEFSPYGTVTRAQIVTILYNMEGRPQVPAASFTDLREDWYREAVGWAQSKGVVTGKTATLFAPNDPVTREQFAAILYRYASYKSKDLSRRGDLSVFTDAEKILPYARSAFVWAVGSEIIQGKGNGILDPKGSTNRAEAAVMMYKFTHNL